LVLKIFQWLLYLTSLGLFIWFIFFKPSNFELQHLFDFEKTKHEKNIACEDTLIKPVKKVPEKIKIDSTLLVIQPKDLDNNPSEDLDVTINTNNTYLVLVGSFGQLPNAQKMLRQVEAAGLNGVVKKIGRLHRVIIAASMTEKDAVAVKNRHKKTFGEVPYVLKQ